MTMQLTHKAWQSTTVLRVASLDAALASAIDLPGYATLRLYRSGAEERVRAIAYDGTTVYIERTAASPQEWPVDTFVEVVETFAGAVPGEAQDVSFFANAVFSDPLSLTYPSPNAPLIALEPSGVAPGDYGGMVVDQFGRITYVDPDWPANALPVFDPAGQLPNGGAGVASLVTYTPQPDAPIVTANNVQQAIEQLEVFLEATSNAIAINVNSVTAGDGIVLTGTSADPVISLEQTGVPTGTYAGFEIDEYGRVLSYTPAPLDGTNVVGADPITSIYNVSTGAFTVGIEEATFSALGAVKLVNPSDILNNTPTNISPFAVLTYQGGVDLIDTTLKARVLASDLADAGELTADDKIAVYDVTTGKFGSATLSDIVNAAINGSTTNGSGLGALFPWGFISDGVPPVVRAGVGVASVTGGNGQYRVTLETARADSRYHVSVTPTTSSAPSLYDPGGEIPTTAIQGGGAPYVKIQSPTVFDVYLPVAGNFSFAVFG